MALGADGGTVWQKGSAYLAIEVLKDQPKPLGLGIPSIKIKDPIKLEASHKKLERRVYQMMSESDVHFEGKPLGRQAGFSEWFAELVKPGEQITTVPNGAVKYAIMFYGYANIFSIEKNLLVPGSINTGYISLFGSDPIPQVRLYGNSKIPFASAGGTSDLMAAVFYDGTKNAVETIPAANKIDIFNRFISNAYPSSK